MKDSWLYLLINVGSIAFPLLFSFHRKFNYYVEWKRLFIGMAVAMLIFIPWDIYFTKLGVWGFNDQYLIGIKLFDLPIEEWMFFICIPFASVFIYHLISFWKLPLKWLELVRVFTLFLAIALLFTALLNIEKVYTLWVFVVSALVLFIYTIKSVFYRSPNFILSYLFILIPFFIVNGLLTGSWINNEVVWYNSNEFMNYRMGTIPLEDTFYGLSLLLLIVIIKDVYKKRADT